MSSIATRMRELGKNAKRAAKVLANAPATQKQDALLEAARSIEESQDEILASNRLDIEYGSRNNLSSAMLDRAALDESRLAGIARALETVADMEDPVGRVTGEWSRPSGLSIRRVSTPLGVIGVIFESRPNVTVDAGSLCLKAGNASILRGGSDSFNSSRQLHACMVKGLKGSGLPEHSIQLVPTRDRDAVGEMLRMSEFIDVIVPRGGRRLVARVQEEARVPVFAHLEGICHVYVDGNADVEKARKVILNAKTRRPGICGAAECVLIDRRFYQENGAPFVSDLIGAGVEVRADHELVSVEGTVSAAPEDFGKEFLDMVIAARVVEGLDGAIEHIERFGSGHTEAIITECDVTAERFFSRLDSAILMQNASTQFADGGEFGMGAEIGIATGKIHARGPVGVEQLTSFKYLVRGDGTVRP